jgi:hypothetical protein
MSSECALFSHIWVDQDYKKDLMTFALKHFRRHNPDSFIILSGHGMFPKNATKYCDKVLWSDTIRTGEVGYGHPKCVREGLEFAKKQGFERVLKQRADCIFACSGVHSYYDSLLGNKKFLVTTHPSTPFVIGDLCMYGDIDVFLEGWNILKWDDTLNGMDNFQNTLACHDQLRYTTIEKMKWVFLDPYWETLDTESILENNFEYHNMLWGKEYSERAQSR